MKDHIKRGEIVMNAELKDYIIKVHNELTGQERQSFLYCAKFATIHARWVISKHLCGWVALARQKAKASVTFDKDNDPDEILKALQEHFATELLTITQRTPIQQLADPTT